MAITLAITNYNSMDHIARLLPQVRGQGFRRIVVLDDASTDASPGWLRTQTDIHLVLGRTNLGPTGNRNRILDVATDDTIVFLDVDMELDGQDVAGRLENEFLAHPDAAVIAPIVLGTQGKPKWSRWAYDTRPWWDAFIGALLQAVTTADSDVDVIAALRRVADRPSDLPESYAGGEVTWVFEQFFAVRADVFRRLGGFDAEFRMFHEGPDYCLRARAQGYQIRISGDITTRHLDLHSGTEAQRARDLLASTKLFFDRHFGIPAATTERIFYKLLHRER